MKLRFDENLSLKLPRLLAALFPSSLHARDRGLKGAADEDLWEYARANGFTIVSKDADSYDKSLLYGSPPKFVWLRVGNCTRDQLVAVITAHEDDLRALDADP